MQYHVYDEYFASNKVQDGCSIIQHTVSLRIGNTKKWLEQFLSLNLKHPNKRIPQKAYSISPNTRDNMYQHVNEMLSSGVIDPTNSKYSSPIVIFFTSW